MTHETNRRAVDGFYQAVAALDLDAIVQCFASNIEWTCFAPIEVIAYSGRHRGLDSVRKIYRSMRENFVELTRYAPEMLLVDGDKAAAVVSIAGIRKPNNRMISHQTLQFMRLEDGKISQFRMWMDSIDTIQQRIGREIDLTPGEQHHPVPPGLQWA
jgi:ketosteroid isomerase-like protein